MWGFLKPWLSLILEFVKGMEERFCFAFPPPLFTAGAPSLSIILISNGLFATSFKAPSLPSAAANPDCCCSANSYRRHS
jgi:hypothetical protein